MAIGDYSMDPVTNQSFIEAKNGLQEIRALSPNVIDNTSLTATHLTSLAMTNSVITSSTGPYNTYNIPNSDRIGIHSENNDLVFCGPHGKELFRVSSDTGEVTYRDDLSAATKMFWSFVNASSSSVVSAADAAQKEGFLSKKIYELKTDLETQQIEMAKTKQLLAKVMKELEKSYDSKESEEEVEDHE